MLICDLSIGSHVLKGIKADIKNITSHKSLFLENTSLGLEIVGKMCFSKCILLYVTVQALIKAPTYCRSKPPGQSLKLERS